MKNRIITSLLALLFGVMLALNVIAIECPSCGNDTYDGGNCINPACFLNYRSPFPGIDMDGYGVIVPLGQMPTILSIPPQQHSTSTGATSTASAPVVAPATEFDNSCAPPWILAKSRKAHRDSEGDDAGVPRLDDLALDDPNSYRKVEPEQTPGEIRSFLNSYFSAPGHGFVILYSSPDGQGGVVEQILVIVVNRYRQIYAFTNVSDYWNVVTQISASDIFQMLDVNTFDSNNEHLTLYGYLGNINYPESIDRMQNIPEDESIKEEDENSEDQ